MGWFSDVSKSLERIEKKTESLERKVDDLMAWLGTALGDPSEFISAYAPGGSDQSPACLYSEASGARVVGVGDTSGVAGSLRIYVYKEGLLLHSASVSPGAGGATWRQKFFSIGKYVFYPGFSGTSVQVRKFDPTTNEYEVPFEEATGATSTDRVDLAMAHDPEENRLYLFTGVPGRYVRLWQLGSDGVKIKRILNESATSNSPIYFPDLGINATDGFAYLGAASLAGGYTYDKVDLSSEDASGTTLVRATGGRPLVGVFGLHFRQHGSYDLYTGDDSSDTWDLSSYLDSEYRITVIRKERGSDTYRCLCAKSNTLYLLDLGPGSSITEIDSVAVDSDHNPTWPDSNLDRWTSIRQASEMRFGQDPLVSGQGTDKRVMVYRPPNRDVM